MSSSKLFQPFKLGPLELKQRIALAPLTRFRANDKHEHTDLAVEYYAQRASMPGTLLFTEATFISPRAGGYPNVPGIWSDGQIAAWKKVTDAVHAKGSFIYLQLWAIGRAAFPAVIQADGYDYVSASAIAMTPDLPVPRPLTVEEIKEYVKEYATAADNAVNKAGFDGVEIHGANGYLLDQFMQSISNDRTDEYGGSIENRLRFVKEVVEAVTATVGQERTGIRFSPWSKFNTMRMSDPVPTFSAIITHLRDTYEKLSYIHVVEPRIKGDNTATEEDWHEDPESNDFAYEIWGDRPIIVAGGYTRETALKAAEKDNVIVAFGRNFLANPDLPTRLKDDLKLNAYNRATFYTPGPVGYVDYPTYSPM
ncbi:putative NADPH2 dehydrogenase chain OYE2 [Peniophora sp. CONT]|nr:putative NADPH2 dehydrogenase chain OYE2 [Peniophora sp. CONT]